MFRVQCRMNESISHWVEMGRKELTRQMRGTARLKYATAKCIKQANKEPAIKHDKTSGRIETAREHGKNGSVDKK